MYDSWAAQHGYWCEEKLIDNKASGAKQKEQKVECLWMNYDPTRPADNEAQQRRG
jgi:hypothetical protein